MIKFLKQNEKALYLILIVFILLMLNLPSAKTAEFGLTPTYNAEKNITEYSPSLSLNKGNYEFSVRSNAGSGIKLNVSALTKENLYSTELSGSDTNFTLELKENLNGITFKTEGNTPALHRVYVKSNSLLYTDTIFVSVAIVLFLLFILWMKQSDPNNEKAAIFIVLSAAIVASYPLFTSYLYFGHDINFHLWRIEGIADGLRAGQFPVRIHPTHNNGYGYITASVYPELFMYFPAILRLLGVTLATSYKSLLFVMNVLTALIMYYSVKDLTKSRFAATISSVLYTLATWRLFGLYARAALGEAMVMTFLPLVVLGLYHIIKGDKSKWYILAIAYTCVFQTHVITTVLTAILSVIIALIFIKDCLSEKRWLAILKALLTTLLLNLWYLVPFVRYYFSLDMLIRQPVTNTEFFGNAIIPAELFNIFNDSFGYSLLLPSGIRGNMSLSLGFTVSACLIFTIGYFIFNKKKDICDYKFTKVYLLCGIGFLFAATSLFPWQLLQQQALFNKFAALVRMPWRFLSVATPLIVLATGFAASKYTLSQTAKKTLIFTICAVSTLFMVHLGTTFTTSIGTAIEKCQTPSVDGSIGLDKEYLVIGTDETKLTPDTYTTSKNVKVESFAKSGTTVKFTIDKAVPGAYVEVPLLYYPGYSAKDENGTKLDVVNGSNNVLRVNLSTSGKNITIKYKGFIYFRIAEIISLLTLAFLIFGKKIKEEVLKRATK